MRVLAQMEEKLNSGRQLKEHEADWVVRTTKVLSEGDFLEASIMALESVPDDKLEDLKAQLDIEDFTLEG